MIRQLVRMAVVVLHLTAATNALAQNARVSGLVMDSMGAVIPGARIAVTNVATGVTNETLSTETGLYTMEGLPAGAYRIVYEFPGFRRFVSESNSLSVGQQAVLDVKLEPGNITEETTVTASVGPLQTSDAQVRTEITGTLVREIPLITRNPLHLILSGAPGVSGRGINIYVNGQRTTSFNTTVDGIDANGPGYPRGDFTTTPINPDTVQEYQLITSNFKAEYGRSSGAQVVVATKSGSNEFHGAVYEYHRNTVLNANPFFNNASGISRPVLIRNQFGFAFGGPIRRDKAFFFFSYGGVRTAQSVPQMRTVLTREARQGVFRYAQGIRNTPSLVDAGGNYIGTAPLQTYDIFANDPLGIGPDRVTAAVIAQTPLPNSFDGGDGLNTAFFRFNAPNSTRFDNYTSRVDFNLNQAHSAFARYITEPYLIDGDGINAGYQRYPGLPARIQRGRPQAAAVSMRSTFSPVVLNEASVGFHRFPVYFDNPQYPNALTTIAGSFTDPVNPFAGFADVGAVSQVKNNLTWVKGSHTSKAGIDFRFTQTNQRRKVGSFPVYPQVTFNRTFFPVAIPNPPPSTQLETNNANTLRSMMMDLLGIWARAQQTFFSNGKEYLPTGGQYVRGHRFREYDYFVQDDWRLTPKLTLNYGIRWEYRPPPFEVNGIMFVPANRDLYSNPGGLSFSLVGKDGDARWFKADSNNLAPAVGLAWNVTGDGRTAIRGGYRIAYDRILNGIVNDSDPATPGASADVISLNNGTPANAGRLANFTSPLAPPATFTTLAPNNRTGRPVFFDPNLRTPYVQQWVLSLQREIARNTTLEVMYVGNKGTRLYRNFNINQVEVHSNGFLESFRVAQNNLARASATGATTGANFNTSVPGSRPVGILATLYGGTIPASANIEIEQGVVGALAHNRDTAAILRSAGLPDTFFRPFPQFELLAHGCTCSNSTYHSLQAQVVRRYADGLTLQASWTLSKALDDFSPAGVGVWVVRDVYNRRLEKGPADFDARHIARGSFVYNLPFGRGKRWGTRVDGVTNQFLGGWQINGLVDMQTGNPVTVVSGRQTLVYTPFEDGLSTADFVGTRQGNFGQVTRDAQGRMVFWTEDQRAQFKFPAAGSHGGTGRNAFYGPAFWNLDLSIYKNFQVRESAKVQFRSEFFNVFNHPVMGFLNLSPNVNLSNANFGRLTSQRNGARVIQFALRVDF